MCVCVCVCVSVFVCACCVDTRYLFHFPSDNVRDLAKLMIRTSSKT